MSLGGIGYMLGVCLLIISAVAIGENWRWSERLRRRQLRCTRSRRDRLPPCSLVRLPGPVSRWRRIWWWLRPGRVL